MSLKLYEKPNKARPAIMYVCASCAECAPESCGFTDPSEIRRDPDGVWLCECCYDHYSCGEDMPNFSDLPPAPSAYQSNDEE